MDTNDLFKLAGKELMLRANQDKDGGQAKKKKNTRTESRSSYWFGNLPFLVACSMKKKKRDGRTG